MTAITTSERAPGELEILRKFINTREPEHPEHEQLSDEPAALRWLRECGLVSKRITKAELAKLEGLREVFRAEILAHNGEGQPERSWSALADYVRESQLLVHIGRKPEEIRLAPARPGSANAAIAGLLAIMYDAIRRNQWRRLKACRKHSCLWAFYDHSKNGSRTWCDMAICGNRVKAQRRRKRLSQ